MEDLDKHAMTFTSFETARVHIKTKGPVGILTMESRNTCVRDGLPGQMHAQQVVVFVKFGRDARCQDYTFSVDEQSELTNATNAVAKRKSEHFGSGNN